MEGPAEALRSRSRSKTPFLRSSCDRESCGEAGGGEHRHAARRPPGRRTTPVKQVRGSPERNAQEPIVEEPEEEVQYTSPSAHRTRNAMRASTATVKTSDYSSEESPDRVRSTTSTEQLQNKLNSQYEYERVSTTSTSHQVYTRGTTLADVSLSPITQPHNYAYNVSSHRSQYSPAHSACSTDSSFAEQALADASKVIERDHSLEHLPYRIYKMAGEYWNKYPKTDYTYSPLSKDRVELAPGQVAVPNMSRRSLSQFRLNGPTTSADELDQLLLQHNTAWQTSTARRRYNYEEDSEDEASHTVNGGYTPVPQHWLLTRWLIAVYTTVTTTVTETYNKIRGREHRYPYTERRQPSKGVLGSAGSLLAAPLVWLYSALRQVVTTTTTTITETITSKDTNNYGSYASQSGQYRAQTYAAKKRRVWPWLLLLLLPLIGYGYYNSEELLAAKETKSSPMEAYVTPKIVQDPDLARRLSVLENWVGSVDSRLNYFDQKLSKIDNMEAQIESYSLKHLQQNLIQIFNINGKDGKLTSDELKSWFDKHYVSKDDIQNMSKKIHEKLLTEAKPGVDEDSVRKIVQEYLAVFEKRQLEILMVRFEDYVRELRAEAKVEAGGGLDAEAVRKLVAGMLNVYDADKTGIVDYALESAGGQVISTKCTELYQIKTKQYSILGMPVWWVYTSPRFALTPGAMPAECWAFQGFPGYLVLRTYAIIEVTGFSVEHMSKLLAADGKIESAPKNFSVYGLREEFDPEPHLFGDYMYDENGTAIQHFPVQHPKTVNIGGEEYPFAYDIIELRVESNYGNPTYTCVYRFRVHGNPLSDIRQATEDSMKEGS